MRKIKMSLHRVAVIGAGAAGLCALRHLTAQPDQFVAMCFEQNDKVGGTWVYKDHGDGNDYEVPVHSSMYKNLKTNLPKEAMAFPDYPFPKTLPSFIRHENVLEYLESYATDFDLLKYIQFETIVDKINPIQVDGGRTTWEITYSHVQNQIYKCTEYFDAVLVCNGHYSEPLIPQLPGMEYFDGEIIHSHLYRRPDSFTGKEVVCLGAGPSGRDIALDVATCSRMVNLSHRKPRLQTVFPNNVKQVPGIKRLTKTQVIFENDDAVDADVIILCTGYLFQFPFLSEACNLRIEDERVIPLYKHLIHTEYPTMSFVGLIKDICPFPQFHIQVKFALAVLSGSVSLPSKEEMDSESEEEFQNKIRNGIPPRYVHDLGNCQWEYSNQLAAMSECEPIPKVVQNLYEEVHRNRVLNITTFRLYNYEITDSETFKVVKDDVN